jgi:hypothetical protein
VCKVNYSNPIDQKSKWCGEQNLNWPHHFYFNYLVGNWPAKLNHSNITRYNMGNRSSTWIHTNMGEIYIPFVYLHYRTNTRPWSRRRSSKVFI